MDQKFAVISGASGQDASYLIELLLKKKYKVLGFSRRTGNHSTSRIDHLMGNEDFEYEEGDVTDSHYITSLLTRFGVHEFYNLAAQSHVGHSFQTPVATTMMDYVGVMNILNAIKQWSPTTRFYQASTSEMFGSSYDFSTPINEQEYLERVRSGEKPPIGDKYQDENTRMTPQSPYAIAKLAAHHLVRLYRESYGLHASCGILFNHESPRRGEKFVTRKIVKWFKECWRALTNVDCSFDDITRVDEDRIYVGEEEDLYFDFPKLRLGNLDASRDWGHAEDYVDAMWLMLQQEKPGDFVVGTGETFTVQDFLKEVCLLACGHEEFMKYVVIDPKFVRPAEVDYLRANPSRIKDIGWKPKHDFKSLVRDMWEKE